MSVGRRPAWSSSTTPACQAQAASDRRLPRRFCYIGDCTVNRELCPTCTGLRFDKYQCTGIPQAWVNPCRYNSVIAVGASLSRLCAGSVVPPCGVFVASDSELPWYAKEVYVFNGNYILMLFLVFIGGLRYEDRIRLHDLSLPDLVRYSPHHA